MKIGQYEIGSRTIIVAEISANHGHDINIVKRTIKAAKDSGADAVKIQTYTPDTITIDCDNDYFKIKSGTIWDGRTLYDLYKEAYTPWEWHKELFEYAAEIGILFFSTPFDVTAVDLLESLNVDVYKVASFEIMDIPLIEYIASKGKPIIISVGIATLNDIDEAVNACRRMGNNQIVLLKCTSEYPAKIEDANLKTIPNMKETFKVEVGLSDHTLEPTTAIVAVALGAKIVEKHFILDKKIGGPDASFSLDPFEFKVLVSSIRNTEKLLGNVDYSLSDKKIESRKLGRSLFVVEDMCEGDVFTEINVRSIRPGFGLAPVNISKILGKKSKIDIKKGTPVNWNMFD